MVGKICTVCKSCSYVNKNLSFFTYPADAQRRYEWLETVDRMDLAAKLENSKKRSNHRICESHFETKYIRRSTVCDGRKYLTKDAFPTLCLDNPSLIVPLPNENLLRSPSSFLYWNHLENMEEEESEMENDVGRQEFSSSPSHCTDMAEFCESVIKVSKGIQTHLEYSTRWTECIPDGSRYERRLDDTNTTTSFMRLCYKFLPDSICRLMEWHLSSKNSGENVNLNLFAMNLYFSGNTYNMIQNMLCLPTIDMLKHVLVPKSTKISDHFLNAFKIKVSNMSVKERICSFSIGSMFLKPNLYYDIKFDRIIGLHDVDGEQMLKPAKYVIVLMVNGILENWKQPIAYSFISEYDNFPEISIWIDEVITILIDIGLDIRAFVADPRSEFLYISDSRSVSPDKTHFALNGRNIFYIYDTSQLLKVVKNNLKSCDFYCNGENTDKIDTIDFCQKLNSLCGILNSKTRRSNAPFKGPFSKKKYQVNFLRYMFSLFENLKVVRKVDSTDVTENMKFIDGFLITIKSVMQLFDDLHFCGAKFLLTNRLSHTCLSRFFMKVKQDAGNEECTPRQLNRCFVRSFVFNMFKKPQGAPSLDDSVEIEQNFIPALELFSKLQSNMETKVNIPLKIFTTDYRLGLPEKNAFVYICGYCYLKCIKRHCCERFKAYLRHFKDRQDKGDPTYLCSVRLDFNVKNATMIPPDNFTEFLMVLETKFKEYFRPDIQISNLGHEIMEEMAEFNFKTPCPCFPVEYLKALFVRVRIFYTIRKNNKMFRKKKGVKLFRVYNL